MTSWRVFPSKPTGKNQYIKLAGTDLWITASVNNVFVYSSALDVDKFKKALSDTLSLWPLIAGRFILDENKHYIIKMSDNCIPVSLIENTDLKKSPLGLDVVIDKNSKQLQPFLDEVKTTNLIGGSQDEPLFRLKLTLLKQSGEWIMGASWSHILGDADAFLRFLNTISRLYQGLGEPELEPVFERPLGLTDEEDKTPLPDIEDFLDGEQPKTNGINNQIEYEQLNIRFTEGHVNKLRELIASQNVSTQDVLSAYIILTLNTHCTQNDDQLILRTITMINYRNVSDSVAKSGLVANAVLMPLSAPFEDPRSLSSIAQTIRGSINQSRNVEFIKSWVATAAKVMRKIVSENRSPKMSISNDRIVVNSNLRFDWAGLVDFGHTNKCRFYTMWTRALYLRIFRLNPVCDGTVEKGAEVAFRLEKDKKEKFMKAWDEDKANDFKRLMPK